MASRSEVAMLFKSPWIKDKKKKFEFSISESKASSTYLVRRIIIRLIR